MNDYMFSNDIITYIDTIPKNNNEDKQKKIIKCLKSYLTAKKYNDTDEEKAFLYFKQCINLLNDIKNDKIELKEDLINIMDETETECSKYLTKAIETTIEKPYNKPLVKTEYIDELFNIVDTGDIHKLKSYKYGELDFNVYNEEGLTPLHYAIKFGDRSFIKLSLKLGAHIDQTTKSNITVLEFTCIECQENDKEMINFIISCGADMRKHLLFRDGKLYSNKGNQIDILLLEKFLMDRILNYSNIKYLSWIFNYLNKDDFIELEYNNMYNSNPKIKLYDLILKLDNYIYTFNKNSRDTYISIIKEELEYPLQCKLGCPTNKLEILLYNLVPFIEDTNYIDNLKLDWLISLEIKYLILKILKNRKKINTHELKNELSELLNDRYINPNIINEGMIQIIASRWLSKIKV